MPACETDLKAFHDLLEATGKYDKIERLLNVTAPDLHKRFRTLQILHPDINELAFYYTGHGDWDDGESYLVLDGYVPRENDIKGLSSTDLYQCLRDFKAKVTFVTLDACHSGTTLIKSTNPYFKPKASFESLYVFAACGELDEAKGGVVMSAFTNGFIEALDLTDGPEIYFDDINRALRTVFKDADGQRPKYTRQSEHHELFCDDKAKLDSVIKQYTGGTPESDLNKETSEGSDAQVSILAPRLSDLQILQAYEERVVSPESAQKTITGFIDLFAEYFGEVYSDVDIFDMSQEVHSQYGAIEDEGPIVRAINRNGRFDSFVVAKEEKQEKKRRGVAAMLASIDLYATKEYVTVFTLLNRTGLEKVHFILKGRPKHKPLSQGCAELVFAPNLDDCQVFFRISFHDRIDWNDFDEATGLGSWHQFRLAWGEVSDKPKQLATRFATALTQHLETIVTKLRADKP